MDDFEVKPLDEFDNGGLLTLVKDWVESMQQEAEPGSTQEQQAEEVLDILDFYESRQSVQDIKDRKD